MAEYMEVEPAAAEQQQKQGDSKKISFRFCREWYGQTASQKYPHITH
jgi:hypothetical protein